MSSNRGIIIILKGFIILALVCILNFFIDWINTANWFYFWGGLVGFIIDLILIYEVVKLPLLKKKENIEKEEK